MRHLISCIPLLTLTALAGDSRGAPCRPEGVRLAVTQTFVRGSQLGFCLDSKGDAAKAHRARARKAGTPLPLCVALDTEKGRFFAVKGPTPKQKTKRADSTIVKLPTNARKLKACRASGGCVTLRARLPQSDAWGARAVDSTFTRAITVTKVPKTGRGGTSPKLQVELFDLQRRRSIRRFRIPGGPFEDLQLRLVDRRFALLKGSAAGPDAQLRALDLRRRRATLIKSGPKRKDLPINAYERRPLRVKGSRWAFFDYKGDTLVLYDLAKGKLLGKAEVGKHYGDATSTSTDEEDSQSRLARVGDKVAVVLGSPSAQLGDKLPHVGKPGTVVLLHGESAKEIAVRSLPVCRR